MSIHYKFKMFGDTRMLVATIDGVELCNYTVAGLIDTVKAYKEIYHV